jgi:hypothetical protein
MLPRPFSSVSSHHAAPLPLALDGCIMHGVRSRWPDHLLALAAKAIYTCRNVLGGRAAVPREPHICTAAAGRHVVQRRRRPPAGLKERWVSSSTVRHRMRTCMRPVRSSPSRVRLLVPPPALDRHGIAGQPCGHAHASAFHLLGPA